MLELLLQVDGVRVPAVCDLVPERAEKGIEIVGAIDVNPDVIGKDIGEILGMSNMNVTVTDAKDARQMLEDTKPDICIVTTRSLIAEVEEPFMLCADLGINAIIPSTEPTNKVVGSIWLI